MGGERQGVKSSAVDQSGDAGEPRGTETPARIFQTKREWTGSAQLDCYSGQNKKGKRPAARRCDLLPLLPSGPDGVQRELAVRDLPLSVRGIPAKCWSLCDGIGA